MADNAVLVMKIEYYAEGLDRIIAWKKREDEESGRFFWGYNGTR
ncbi:MAG TPA: hypothetical protein VKV57_14365 [bacterium]|nr:hypothetical protein [bacterium]